MRTALVHDYLTQYGGAERVLLELQAMFPEAPVLTSVADFDELPAAIAEWDVRESRMTRLPGVSRYHRGLLPLYPISFRELGRELDGIDVVVADSSAWAHHVGVDDQTALICYCHSPARFLYGDATYLGPARLPIGLRHAATLAFAGLRRSDKRAAAWVDLMGSRRSSTYALMRRPWAASTTNSSPLTSR